MTHTALDLIGDYNFEGCEVEGESIACYDREGNKVSEIARLGEGWAIIINDKYLKGKDGKIVSLDDGQVIDYLQEHELTYTAVKLIAA